MKVSGAIVIFSHAKFSGYSHQFDAWDLIELNLRHKIHRAARY